MLFRALSAKHIAPSPNTSTKARYKQRALVNYWKKCFNESNHDAGTNVDPPVDWLCR